MKKKRMFALLLAMVMVCSTLVMTGCGGGGTKSAFAGEWTAVVVEMEGMSVAMNPETDGEIKIIIKEDGKGEVSIDGESETCEWKEENGALTITIDDESVTGKAGEKDNTLVFDNWVDSGITFIFGKVGTDAADPKNYEVDM